MAKAKRSRGKQPKPMKESKKATVPAPAEASTGAEAAKPAAKKKAAKSKRRGRRVAAKKTQPTTKSKPVASKQPRKRRSKLGKRYTPAERAKILAAARSEGLTGAQVSKRFGVSALSYYTWRRKAGAATPRGPRPGRPPGAAPARPSAGGPVNILEMIRSEIRSQIARLTPDVIQSEIGLVFGVTTGRQRRRH